MSGHVEVPQGVLVAILVSFGSNAGPSMLQQTRILKCSCFELVLPQTSGSQVDVLRAAGQAFFSFP